MLTYEQPEQATVRIGERIEGLGNRTVSESDRLRELLDEDGEPYVKNELGITWRYFSDPHTATESMDGTLIVTGLTAEQVIRATREDCHVTCIRLITEGRFEYTFSCGHGTVVEGDDRPMYCPRCGRKVRKA